MMTYKKQTWQRVELAHNQSNKKATTPKKSGLGRGVKMALGKYWVLESRVDNSKGEFMLVYSHRHDFDLCAIAYYDKHRHLIQTHHGTSETCALFAEAWKRGEPIG